MFLRVFFLPSSKEMTSRNILACLFLGVVVCAIACGAESCGSIKWSFENGTLTISGEGSLSTSNCPGINEKKEQTRSIIIKERISSIEDSVFSMWKKLESVEIPKTVRSIGYSAFYGCEQLKSVAIPGSVVSINSYTFECCYSLETLTLSEGIGSIGYNAFYLCKNLRSVTIPNSVHSIDSSAFSCCHALTEIQVGTNNTKYVSVDGILFSKDMKTLIVYPGGIAQENYVIPSSVSTIGAYSFSGCKSLQHIIIHENVTEIGNNAFYACVNLDNVTIPRSIKKIKQYTFQACHSLTTINNLEDVESIGESAFENCVGLRIVNLSAITIGSRAFSTCSHLTTVVYYGKSDPGEGSNSIFHETAVSIVTLPRDYNNDSFCGIGSNQFKRDIESDECGDSITWRLLNGTMTIIGEGDILLNCSSLQGKKSQVTSINIKYGITSVGNQTFKEWSKLTSVNVAGSVRSIGANSFSGCSCLETMSIPEGVRIISEKAFYGCSKLSSVFVPNSVTSIGAGTFLNCSNLSAIEVGPSNSFFTSVDGVLFTKDMKTLNQYPAGREAEQYGIPGSVRTVGANSFSGCKHLKDVNIPDGVNSISEGAFRDCTSLRDLVIPPSVVAVEQGSFDGCSDLETVTFLGLYDPGKAESFSELKKINLRSNYRNKTFCGYGEDTMKRIIYEIRYEGIEEYAWYINGTNNEVIYGSSSTLNDLLVKYHAIDVTSTSTRQPVEIKEGSVIDHDVILELCFKLTINEQSWYIKNDSKIDGNVVHGDKTKLAELIERSHIMNVNEKEEYDGSFVMTGDMNLVAMHVVEWEGVSEGLVRVKDGMKLNEIGGLQEYEESSKYIIIDKEKKRVIGLNSVITEDMHIKVELFGGLLSVEFEKMKEDDVMTTEIAEGISQLTGFSVETISVELILDEDGFVVRALIYVEDEDAAERIVQGLESVSC